MKFINLAIIALLIAGCGTVRKNKNKTETKTETNTVTDLAIKTTTEEIADTCVNVPGGDATGEFPILDVLSGDTLSTENNGTKVAVHYNKKTGKLTATAKTKPREVPIKIHKKTVQESTSKIVAKEKTEAKTVIAEKKKDGLPWYGWALFISWSLFILLFLGWRLYKFIVA